MFLRIGKEDFRVALKDTGTVLTYSGLSFFIPIIIAILLDKDPFNLLAFALSALGVFALGYILRSIETKKETEIKHALLSIVLIWILYCFFASLPFVFLMKTSFLDSFFEAMSSLTTTGLSIMVPLLDSMPPSLIFWRTFLGWIGGIGIVLMALIGLITTYSKTSKLLIAEGRGDQLKENLKTSAKKISGIYIVLTVIGIILLLFSGQTLWQATNYSMSAISTNGMDITTVGLTTTNNGWLPIGVNNYWVEISLVIIMILGAISFSLYYLAFKKKSVMVFFKDSEFRLLMALGIIGTIIVSTKMGLMTSFFHTFSAVTCGGFAYLTPAGIGSWDDFAKIFLVVLMIIGGSAGSTAGGIKLSRAIIFVKGIYWKIKQSILPENSFFKKSYNGEQINDSQLKEINQFILLWIVFIFIGVIVLAFHGYGLGNVFFEVASAQSNAGISTGITVPGMPIVVEVMLIINMFVGRLEIIPILASIGLILSLKRR